MSELTPTTAQIVGVFLECVVYGIFVVLWIAACFVQWEKFSKTRRVNYLIAYATVFFGLSITINLIISLSQATHAILSTPPGAAVYLNTVPPLTTSGIIWFLLFQFQATTADIIVVYRMYHIYQKNPLVCIAPSITILGLFASGCAMTKEMHRNPPSPKGLAEWATICFCFSILNSVILTTGISYKLWRVHRETVMAGIQVEDSVILRVMRTVIESAALWSVFATLNFVSSAANSSLTYTFLAISGPAVGISFCLIIVRLGHISLEARDDTWHSSNRTPTSGPSASVPISLTFAQVKAQQDTGPSEDFPMEALESQKEVYVDPPGDLVKVVRTSISSLAP